MTVKKISPKELYEKLKQEEVVLLDVRAEEKYQGFHIEGTNVHSLNIPKNNIFDLAEDKDASIDALPEGKELIVTCTTGNSATKCANILAEKQYDVVVLDGGITAWKSYLETKRE